MAKTKEAPAPLQQPNPGRTTAREQSPFAFDERQRTIAWMNRTVHRLYNAHAKRILDQEGITMAHWFYLRVLSERGTINQLELSKRVGIASTTAVTALDNLEKRGLLRRSRDENDRRKYFVGLTEAGQGIVDRLMPEIERMVVASVEGIPEEDMRAFWRVLHLIADRLSAGNDGETVLD